MGDPNNQVTLPCAVTTKILLRCDFYHCQHVTSKVPCQLKGFELGLKSISERSVGAVLNTLTHTLPLVDGLTR